MRNPIHIAATERPDLDKGLSFEERRQSVYDQIATLGPRSSPWRVSLWPRWLLRLGWSKDRSASLPIGIPGLLPGRTIYLSDRFIHTAFAPDELRRVWTIYGHPLNVAGTAVLAHELEHARSQESAGRWRWMAAYVGGPLLAALAVIVSVLAGVLVSPVAGVSAALVGSGAVLAVWSDSEAFRLSEELLGYARAAALRSAVLLVDPDSVNGTHAPLLHGLRWPYLIWAGGRSEAADEAITKNIINSARLMIRFQRREILPDQNGMSSSALPRP